MKTLALFASVVAFALCASAVEIPLPTGWRNIEGVRQGPEGSFSIFGPFSAATLDQAVIQRIARLNAQGTKMTEKKRENIQMPGAVHGLKILFEVSRNGYTYLSPHYFLMTGVNDFYVIKTIPKTTEFTANSKAINDHIMK